MAFPKFEIAGFAWVAPGLLLFSAAGLRSGSAFRIGYLGGVFYYLISLYWLLHIPVKFLPIAGWLALSFFLALYPACWVWLGWRFWNRSTNTLQNPFRPEIAQQFFDSTWLERTFWTVKLAALWVTMEIVIGRFLSGFPWDFLGVSQYKMTPLLQICSFTGVYGVSFLIIWFSTSLMVSGLALVQSPENRHAWMKEITLPLLVVLGVTSIGYTYATRYRPSPKKIKVALVQPSIPQTLIWDARENDTRFRQLLELSERALSTKPDLLIWPEASVPNMIRQADLIREGQRLGIYSAAETRDALDYYERFQNAITSLCLSNQVWAILGSDDAVFHPGAKTEREIDYYNSAFAISPKGEIAASYRKRRLVIFGEYVPFVKWLPFLKVLSPAGEGGFTPGEKPIPFHLDSLGITVSVLICFEDTFPHIAREYVNEDTDFLVNLTNNGWFGESAAQWQHAATAAFRAIENRVPLVRCANNGLTCWVDEVGRLHNVYYPGTTDIYGAGFKTVLIPVLAPGEKRVLSFYTRHGDLFGWGCVILSILEFLRIIKGTVARGRIAISDSSLV